MTLFNLNMEKFFTNWGEMASMWCVNRNVAEGHGLIFPSGEPLNADGVARALYFSSSYGSASMRELENRGLIIPVGARSDRKKYYETARDPREALRVIFDDHKRRVTDLTAAMFRMCLEERVRTAPEDSYTSERMRDVVSFSDGINPLYNKLRHLPNGPIQNLPKVVA